MTQTLVVFLSTSKQTQMEVSSLSLVHLQLSAKEILAMNKLILWITHRVWNREISRLMSYAYEKRHINSEQLHVLTSWFDPTQKHCLVGKEL